MSDTDDTDALLAIDPNGGLEMYLGLSLRELSDKHRHLLTASIGEGIPATGTETRGENNQGCSTGADSSVSNLEIDTSDFLNSQGELILSGVSEWSESDDDEKSRVEEIDDQSEAESETSFTYEQKSTDKRGTSQPSTANLNFLNPRNSNNFRIEEIVESVSDGRILEVNDMSKMPLANGNPIVDFMNQFHNITRMNPFAQLLPPSHARVVDINLLRPASGWKIPVPNQTTGQVFTRAPNFRTPGGYVPPENEEEARDLTKEELQAEVRSMYSEENKLEDELSCGDGQLANKSAEQTPQTHLAPGDIDKVSNTQEESGKTRNAARVRFDISSESETPQKKAVKRKETKSKKRRHLISNNTSDKQSEADSTQSETPSSRSVDDTVKVSSKSMLSMDSNVPYSTKVVRGKRSGKRKEKAGFSFGFGEVLSPIKGEGGETLNTPTASSDLMRKENINPINGAPFNVCLADLKNVWREIQHRRHQLENDVHKAVNSFSLGPASEAHCDGDTADTSVSTGRDVSDSLSKLAIDDNLSRKSKDKKVSMNCRKSSQENASSVPQMQGSTLDPKYLPMLESFASDLESILHEADIEPDDFDDIIDQLGLGEDINNTGPSPKSQPPVAQSQHDVTNEIDAEFSNAYAQVQLSDWAKSGAVEYVEKYRDERIKRDHCEIEIQKLQKELLDIKQKNAVLEAKVKQKDVLLHQISSAWNHVSKEWKSHEATSRTALSKLQEEQTNLISACNQGKERIADYEKELMKTVELADSFKSKLAELEDAKLVAIMKLEDEKSHVLAMVAKLENDVDSLKEDKEAALRALREAQLQLDERQAVRDRIETELKALQDKSLANTHNLNTLLEQRDILQNHVENLSIRKLAVEQELLLLREELEKVKMEKEDLRRNLEDSAARKLSEEANRLHEYYQNNLQQILNSAKEQASRAQTILTEKMTEANALSEQKLLECKERCRGEICRLKSEYDSTVQDLKKENLQKQLLISTTAQQLQTGEMARSGAVNRLQTIVSSFPNPLPSLAATEIDLRRRGTKSVNFENQQHRNNLQYTKFTENLDRTQPIVLSQSAPGFQELRPPTPVAKFEGFSMSEGSKKSTNSTVTVAHKNINNII